MLIGAIVACPDKPVTKSTQKGSDTKNTVTTFEITFEINGGSDVAAKKVSAGKIIAQPDDPTRKGFHFAGWYKDEKRSVPFKFDTEKITKNITLYADWLPMRTIATGTVHTLYIKDDGTLWAWGHNGTSQFGIPTKGSINTSPVKVSSDTWRMVSAGRGHSVGIKTDGTLWTWGWNNYGQLGIKGIKAGKRYGSPSPLQVGSDTWRMVSAGIHYTIGIKKDGTLWTWGHNKYGQLGLGDTTDRNTPTQVGSDTWRWIDIMHFHTAGIKADGTLWTWGWNNDKQLGFGDKITRKEPTQVGSDTWRMVVAGFHHSAGIKTDGTVQIFGGTRGSSLKKEDIPENVTGKWHMIDLGRSNIIGIKEDGTLWTLGNNNEGELGIGNTTKQTSFTKVGSSTWHMAIAGAEDQSFGIKKDGTLWAWGRNKYGELGLGNRTNQNSPVEVTIP